MVIELRHLSNGKNFRALRLTALEVRRKRRDLMQICKINGVVEVDINMGIDVQGGYSGESITIK